MSVTNCGMASRMNAKRPCLEEIRVGAHNMIPILVSIINMVEKTYTI